MPTRHIILPLLLLATLTCSAQTLLPYQNPSLGAEARARDLLSRLTLEEKAQLMLDVSEPVTRLGIPKFQWWNEALHGVGRNGFTTVFPITVAMAASWDDALLQKCFSAASDEARVKNQQAKRHGNVERYQGLSFWTPNINIFRDPRWGRGQETYGEDPYLTERMGLAATRGLQGPDEARYRKTLACAKHFAVHSGPEWNRHTFNIEELPARDLWETYLPAFKALVQKGGVEEVMCAYQRIDGEPCCGNTRYLQQILREEWGFRGIVVSDCGALRDFHQKGAHEVTPDATASAAKATLAGTDVNCGSVYKSIPEAVRTGQTTQEAIDACVLRLLTARFRLGDFDPDSLCQWTKIPEATLCSPAHSALARRMAEESIVLLQNKNNLLPLKRDGLRLAVLGPNAADSVMQWGNYSGYPRQTTTILQGIERKLAGRGEVKYIAGAGHTSNAVPQSHFRELTTPDGRPGMAATYWNNTSQDGTPAATATYTAPIHLNNGGNTVFAPGVELENFSARYTATFRPTSEGDITMALEADDGYRLIIDGDTVQNRFRPAHGVQKLGRQLHVRPGEEHSIVIDYLQLTGMAHFQFDIYHTQEVAEQDIVAATADCDAVVFVGGISPRLEGEEMKVDAEGFRGGDRTDIELPACQRTLIAALAKAGRRIVLVNCSGSAIALVPETKAAEAIVQAWYGGERGGDAVADILFGDVNPSGKLPITFYKSVADLPDFLDYRMAGRTYRYFHGEPLFAFGYGLSYTTFRYGKPVYKDGSVSVRVANTGTRDGDETVQVYIRRPADTGGPEKTLRAFQRVSIPAGESRDITLPLPRESFCLWDADTNTMRVVTGKHEIMVGSSSRGEDLTTITVKVK